MKFKELKQRIKALSTEIKEKKSQRKGAPSGYVAGLDDLRYKVRHHHIAYCLLRGRTMLQIEQSTRDDNTPNMTYVNKIKVSIEPREILDNE